MLINAGSPFLSNFVLESLDKLIKIALLLGSLSDHLPCMPVNILLDLRMGLSALVPKDFEIANNTKNDHYESQVCNPFHNYLATSNLLSPK